MPIRISAGAAKPYDEIRLVRLVDSISNYEKNVLLTGAGVTWVEDGLSDTQADLANRELAKRGMLSRVLAGRVNEIRLDMRFQYEQPDDGSDSTAGAG